MLAFRWSSARRFLVPLFALLFAIYGARSLLDIGLGQLVRTIFAVNTGCQVEITSPRLELFPLRGVVKDVLIKHPDEPANHGVRVGEVSVKLDLWPLRRKLVALRELELKRVVITSHSEESGWTRLLLFIFGELAEVPPEPAWHDFISSNWDVRLSDMRLKGVDSTELTLDWLLNGTQISGKRISFEMGRKNPLEGPYRSSLVSKDFVFSPSPKQPIKFGEINAEALISGDWIKFFAIEGLRLDDCGAQCRLSADGELSFESRTQLNFNFDLKLPTNALPSVLPSYHPGSLPSWVRATRLKGIVKGEFESISLHSELELELAGLTNEGELIVSCIAPNLTGALTLIDDRLEFTGHNTELVSDLSLTMLFADELPVSLSTKVDLRESQGSVKECKKQIESLLLSRETDPRTLTLLAHALFDSTLEIAGEAGIRSRSYQVTIDGDAHQKSLRDRSKFQIKVSGDFNEFSWNFQESGNAREVAGLDDTREGQQLTAFKTKKNAEIISSGSYNFTTKHTELKRLVVNRYPFQRLLARFAPFVSESSFDFLWNASAGSSSLSAEFGGEFSNLNGIASVDDLMVESIPIDQVSGVFSIRNDRLSLSNVLIDLPGGQLIGQVSFQSPDNIELELNCSQCDLSQVVKRFTDTDFGPLTSDVLLSASGALANPEVELAINLLSSAGSDNQSFAAYRSRCQAAGPLNDLAVNCSLVDEQAELEGQILNLTKLDQALIQASLTLQSFPLNLFSEPSPFEFAGVSRKRSLAEVTDAITGRATFTLPLNQPLDSTARVVIESWLGAEGEQFIPPNKPARIEINERKLNFSDVTLVGGARSLQLSGGLSFSSGWDAKLDGVWDLAQIVPANSGLEQLSGLLTIDLGLSGPPLSPQLDGSLSLEEGALAFFVGSGILGASELVAKARFENDQIELLFLKGLMGSGEVNAKGRFSSPFKPSERSANLDLAFDNILLEPAERLSIQLSGTAGMNLSSEILEIKARTSVDRALYENQISLSRLLSALRDLFSDTAVVSAPSATRESEKQAIKTKLALEISAENNVIIDTSIAQAEFRGDLFVSGSVSDPNIDGQLSAIDGAYGFRSSRFEIVRAEISFPLEASVDDPELDLLGETFISAQPGQEYLVQMFIRGTLSDPRVRFVSDSGLSQDQIVSLLGFNASIDAFSFQSGGDAGQAGLFELLNPASSVGLEERFSGLSGFSEVSVSPSVSSETGEFVPELKAIRPVNDRLSLKVQSSLSAEQSRDIALEYSLTPKLKATLGWRTNTVGNRGDSTDGAVHSGLRFNTSFPGTSFLGFSGRQDD